VREGLRAGHAYDDFLRERRGEYRPNPRSLFFHAWQTLAPTLLGFVIGGLAGILLAVGIVHNRAMDLSVMPWAIASQTIPILAIAPMIIVVLNSIGLEGLIPKSLISAYLSFFPVVVGMVKGLRSPGAMDLDLLRTYSASGSETFWKLRLPASVPFLFASLKVGIAAALVGTIVAELPTGRAFRPRRAAADRELLRTDDPDLVGAFHGGDLCGGAGGDAGLIERMTLRRMGLDR
jgi:NitT/TauT family transport system permease protein